MTDSIHIEQLEVYARVGVTESERSQPQRITLNVSLLPTAAFAGLEDDINRTVNYAEVCRTVRELVQTRTTSLIETLASNVAESLLRDFQARAVTVEIRKYVLPNTEYVAVTTRREANES